MPNYFYTSNLTSVLLSVILAVFIYFNGKKLINRLFAAYSLCVAAWAGLKFVCWITSPPHDIFYMRLSIAVAIFIPVVYYHFSAVFNEKNRNWTRGVYLAALVLFPFSFSGLMIRSLNYKDAIKVIVPGPAYVVFMLFFMALILLGFINYFRGLKDAEIIRKNQIRYLILASIAGFAGGGMVFFSNLVPQLEPIGYGFIPLYSVIAAYAIIRHHLLDIAVVIRGSIVYSLLTIFVSAVYFLSFLAFRENFKSDSVLVNYGLIIIFVFLIQPLQIRIQTLVDHLFFREKIDREKAIAAFIGELPGILGKNNLLDYVAKSVKNILKIQSASLYVKEANADKYYDLGLDVLPGEFPEQLKSGVVFISNKELLMPAAVNGEILGVLRVKDKLSGEAFTLADIELLKIFLNQTAQALKNSSLHEEIIEHERRLFQAGNLAAVGTLAAGMAHEIKNPMAVIKGLTQVLPENLEDKEFTEKFVSIIPVQIDRINNTIEALLKMGKGPALKKEKVSINALLLDVVNFLKLPLKKKKIDLITEFAADETILGDYNMLYQAVFNLIQNSAQSIEGEGAIIIRTEKGGKATVQDSGCGIAPEKLEKIFSPFYTSKVEGSGLGLFMVKKILENHDAKIGVSSEPGRGTRFCIDFQNN